MKKERRKSKPSGASAPSWEHFECYMAGRLKDYAICKLCMEQEEFERAEIKYIQSPSNLLRHLNTDFPSHRQVHDKCVATASGKNSATGAGAGIGAQGTPGISSYFEKDTTGWREELVRWMVANAIPFR